MHTRKAVQVRGPGSSQVQQLLANKCFCWVFRCLASNNKRLPQRQPVVLSFLQNQQLLVTRKEVGIGILGGDVDVVDRERSLLTFRAIGIQFGELDPIDA